MLPNFIGIGAPKTGTTWLFKCLEEHPKIFLPDIKEVMFFDYLYDENKIADYLDIFQGKSEFTAIGEFSPNYLASENAAERIKKHNPNIKLILSLRNPIDQVYSYYWHACRQNVWLEDLEKLSFEEAIDRYPEFFLKHSFYMRNLTRWLKCFDSSQIHIIIYDDIVNKPQSVIKELYSFLGVDDNFIPSSCKTKDLSVRQGTSPKNKLLGKIHAFIYQKIVIYFYNPLCDIFGYPTMAKIKEYLKFRQLMHLLFYRKGYQKITEKAKNNLKIKFAEEVKQLSTFIDRDMAHWLE